MATAAALIIYPDFEILDFRMPTSDRLKTMYRTIGCERVDVVRLTSTLDMWIDDEGLYNHPVNPLATALARRHGYDWQPYHGTVILAGVTEDGDAVDLDVHQIRGVLTSILDLLAC